MSRLLLLLLLFGGCRGPLVVPCDNDQVCHTRDYTSGSCTTAPSGNKYCAFPDAMCGQRWDETAGEGLGGNCVASPDMGAPRLDMATAIHISAWLPKKVDAKFNGSFYGVYAVKGTQEIYVCGEMGAIYYSNDNGKNWARQGTPLEAQNKALLAIWGSDSQNIWAVGEGGTLLFKNGNLWTKAVQPSPSALHGVWGTNSQDIWVVGTQNTVLHNTGAGWGAINTNIPGDWSSIWVAGEKLYLVGNTGLYSRKSSQGKGWDKEPTDNNNPLYSIWGSGPNDVYVTGGFQTLLHWEGQKWGSPPELQPQGQGEQNPLSLYGVWGSGPNEVYAVGSFVQGGGQILFFNGKAWAPQTYSGSFGLYAIHGRGPAEAFIAGGDGEVLIGNP